MTATIPNRIAEARRKAGMSQAILAKQIGMSHSMLGKLERGEREMTFTWWGKIAEALDTPIGQLIKYEQFDFDDAPAPPAEAEIGATLADRIAQRLAVLGISERAASMKATGQPDAIRFIRTRGVEPSWGRIVALATVLKTTPDHLAGRRGHVTPSATSPNEAAGLARVLAGFLGPEFDSLPKDRAELREWQRYGGSGQADETQDGLIEMATAAIAYLDCRRRRSPQEM